MNMFKKVKAKDVNEYISNLEDKRKEDIIFLHNYIIKNFPKLKSHFAYNMLGYGSFKYLDYKKQIIDWPIVALASQKNYISIYVCSIHNGKYLAETYKEKLGKVTTGKSCIKFKKKEDINLDTLHEVLTKAQEKPGLRA